MAFVDSHARLLNPLGLRLLSDDDHLLGDTLQPIVQSLRRLPEYSKGSRLDR